MNSSQPPESLDLQSFGESSYDGETSDFYPAVFKYIQDMLMEEDLEDQTSMLQLQDCLPLQAAEKSFYDVLGQNDSPLLSHEFFPSSTHRSPHIPTSSVVSCNSHNLAELNSFSDQIETFLSQPFHISGFLPSMCGDDHVNFSTSTSAATGNQLKSKGRNNDQQSNNDNLEEGRRKKHSVVSTEESEQLEKFDNSFLQKVENKECIPCPLYDALRNEESKKFQQNEQSQASLSRIRRQPNNNNNSIREMMNLSTRLVHCAEAAGRGDQATAYEQLKLIRLHSSRFGDGNQRLAHYFAKALEARLAGFGKLSHSPLPGASASAADILKAYQLYVSICPFRKMSNFFTNRNISRAAEKATTLHIIDFGISYGFQWPCLISRLSARPGGPPKIRITGIDFPQPGFRPAERVEETGRRLKRLADKLNVPFEYNAIAQRWDTINLHDLKIEKDEAVAVCCMYRLKNLPDDTILRNSPRDGILNLIKSINPVIFIHGIVNGSYNAPFFVSRFREAFFHFSALFNMFETISYREDQNRLVYEEELIGKEVMNVIACEGIERYERPDTYKQWQIRNSRIGLEQIPLQKDIMKKVKKIKNDYHKDFVIDEDGHWMLMGWKGRIIHAISAWKAVQD